jgi:hypothetical protein
MQTMDVTSVKILIHKNTTDDKVVQVPGVKTHAAKENTVQV